MFFKKDQLLGFSDVDTTSNSTQVWEIHNPYKDNQQQQCQVNSGVYVDHFNKE
jgi:hypothetical protein